MRLLRVAVSARNQDSASEPGRESAGTQEPASESTIQFLVALFHPVVVSRRVAEYLWAREYQREVEFPLEPECLMRLLRDAVSAGGQAPELEPGRELG
jgi:hypothetical protein